MPLTLQELEDIQAECMADDVDIVFEKMSLWDEDTARDYFENGGVLPPGATLDAPKPAARRRLLLCFRLCRTRVQEVVSKVAEAGGEAQVPARVLPQRGQLRERVDGPRDASDDRQPVCGPLP